MLLSLELPDFIFVTMILLLDDQISGDHLLLAEQVKCNGQDSGSWEKREEQPEQSLHELSL